MIVAGFGGSARAEVPARVHDALVAYPAAPTLQRDVINCDAGEIAALSCLAVDGVTTIPLSSSEGRGGSIVSTMSVPVSVRPDTNFAWRSDPFGVNDGPSNRLNPRGDWFAAYWLGRLLDRDPSKNLIAPDAIPPVVGPDGGTGTSGGGGDAGTGTSGGAGAGPGVDKQQVTVVDADASCRAAGRTPQGSSGWRVSQVSSRGDVVARAEARFPAIAVKRRSAPTVSALVQSTGNDGVLRGRAARRETRPQLISKREAQGVRFAYASFLSRDRWWACSGDRIRSSCLLLGQRAPGAGRWHQR